MTTNKSTVSDDRQQNCACQNEERRRRMQAYKPFLQEGALRRRLKETRCSAAGDKEAAKAAKLHDKGETQGSEQSAPKFESGIQAHKLSEIRESLHSSVIHHKPERALRHAPLRVCLEERSRVLSGADKHDKSAAAVPANAPDEKALTKIAEPDTRQTEQQGAERRPAASERASNARHYSDLPENRLPAHRGLFSRLLQWILSSPARTITVSFAMVCLLGSLLLSLPAASHTHTWTSYKTALFTATSATCVTGLVVQDTATYWSVFGQTVIILLIQIGGLGLITITSFFMLAMKRRVNLKTMLAMQESTGSDGFVHASDLVKRIFSVTFTVEFIGGVLASWRLARRMPPLQAIRRGFFYSISAFCNAGFDLMGDYTGPDTSLMHWNDDPILLILTAVLIIIGGLGFLVWTDLIAFPKRRQLRFHSSIVLRAAAVFILTGTVLFCIFEWNNNSAAFSMGSLKPIERPVAGFFQAVSLRTAGFSSIDQGSLSMPSKLLSIFFMFIGAGPASTGGGIKTTTFLVIIAACWSYLRGRKECILHKRRIPYDVFMRAFVIFILGWLILALASFSCLFIEEPAIAAGRFSFIDILYECSSAFATVGCSTIGTTQLSGASQLVLILMMYLGRVGPTSFAMGFTMRKVSLVDKVYPEGRTFVG